MEDGILKVKFTAGEIKGVSVNAGLDLTYQRLFETAKTDLRKTEPSIEAGISLIIFGCFWLEAVCNETSRKLLQASTKPDTVAQAVWESIKRINFNSKLSIISAFAKNPNTESAESVINNLKEVFELRNRLAHFKDEDTPVAGSLNRDEFIAKLDKFSDPDLITKLKPPSTDIYAKAIEQGIEWLNKIYKEYYPNDKFYAIKEIATESETS